LPPVSESASQQGAIPKEEALLRRYLDRAIRTIESVRDARDEFDQAFRISEAIRMTARAIERMRLNLSITDSAPFITSEAHEYYLMLDMGVPKVRVITRRNGKVLNVSDWWLSDRYNFHPSIKATMFRSRLSAFLRRIAEELRKRNQDERADQISRLAEAIEKAKALEQMSGGRSHERD